MYTSLKAISRELFVSRTNDLVIVIIVFTLLTFNTQHTMYLILVTCVVPIGTILLLFYEKIDDENNYEGNK